MFSKFIKFIARPYINEAHRLAYDQAREHLNNKIIYAQDQQRASERKVQSLADEIGQLRYCPPVPKTVYKEVEKEVIRLRLDREQYLDLAKKYPLTVPNDAIQAATYVGIQMVLRDLRTGWVVGE